jgi:dCMP deaminase
LKYKLIEHCDRNAIYSAARIGVSLEGCTMYLTGPPCHDCMRGIIQCGIVEVVWPADNKFERDEETFKRWSESFMAMNLLAVESGVRMRRVEGV